MNLAISDRIAQAGWLGEHDDPEVRMGSHVRLALRLIAILTLVFVISMVLIPIGGAVVAAGQVGVESRVKRIAHPTGGTIAEIYVANGDHVAQGQPLLRLDNEVTGTQSALSSLTVSQLLAQKARLGAERLGLGTIAFPDELSHNAEPGAAQAIADELKLFRIRRAEAAGLRAQLSQRITQYNKQIAGYRAQIGSLRQQQELIAPEREGVKELWEKGLVTISRKNQLERTAADMAGTIGALEAQIAQAQARISETSEQMIQLGETRRAEAGTQLAAVNNTLNDQQIRSVTAGDVERRSLIRAPYAGVVDKLAFATIGDVVRPAETILEIVPDRDRLLVELSIAPSDIDQLQPGQKARIRFTAFNSTATPELTGELLFVAPERTTNPQTQQSFYAGRVSVDASDLRRHPEIALKPGMPAEVFIKTGSRSMLSYVTKPLRDQLARAFNDN